jgi:hypothetical protein
MWRVGWGKIGLGLAVMAAMTSGLALAQDDAPSSTGVPAPAVAAAPGNTSRQVKVPATSQWTDTGIDLAIGQRVLLTCQGQIQYNAMATGPEGMKRDWRDLMRALPVNAVGVGALIGRIGPSPAPAFLIGARKEITAHHAGRLFLGVNVTANDSGGGEFDVSVEVFPVAASAPGAGPAPVAQIALSDDLLNRIPRRISDQQGNAGDMVNFVVVGSQESLLSTFEAAGWHLADKTKQQAVLNAIVSSLSKNAYLQMPMSELYLFGRAQDYGYEHADPLQMVAERHHLRLWKAPFEVAGQTLWIGAATHDIGFERDQRNNGVTHKIDPEVDKEREFVGETLNATGNVASLSYASPADAVKEARTATGGSWHSDGRVMVIQLR